VSLATRLAKAEAVIPAEDADRQYLLRCFADPEYDGRREELVEALLRTGQYNYSDPDRDKYCVVSWQRNQRPYRKAIILHLSNSLAQAVMGKPLVREYQDDVGKEV
jgi:hypothetical protein